jgi:hypothetical protein
MDKAIATAHFAQEDALGRFVEQGHQAQIGQIGAQADT